MEVAVSHGCEPIGRERTVTRAEGCWVHEIDGRPAWDVFREYLLGDPTDLDVHGVAYLCVGCSLDATSIGDYGPFVIRNPMRLDAATGSLFFAGGDIRSGQRIHLTRRDPARIQAAARACATSLVPRDTALPAVVFQFDCAGRGKLIFGQRASEEVPRPLLEVVGSETPCIGFHTFGEIAPLGPKTYYHNYSAALCALYDD
jgi:hypothetical protein